jgi:hypothetical protein
MRRAFALRKLFQSDRRKNAPEVRGLRLLRAWLSPAQLIQFDTLGYFDVRGSVTARKYRIHLGVSANIEEIGENDVPKCGWCFVPVGQLVPGDVMLAQKIALETDEYAALAVANQLPAMMPAIHQFPQRRR